MRIKIILLVALAVSTGINISLQRANRRLLDASENLITNDAKLKAADAELKSSCDALDEANQRLIITTQGLSNANRKLLTTYGWRCSLLYEEKKKP
jgi:hypothetical protein